MHPKVKVSVVRRSYITLLEVLIALGLTMLLLSTLTFFYQQMSFVNTRMDVIQDKTFHELFVHTRFSKIFPTLIGEKPTRDSKAKRGDFYFFTSPNQGSLFKPGTQNLIFTYNNGVNLNKSLSNDALGRLYVSPQNQLILATWPAPSRWASEGEVTPTLKKEILMDNVENIAFEFYVAPERNRDALKKYEKKKDTGSQSKAQTTQKQAPVPPKPGQQPPQQGFQPQEIGKGADRPPNPDPTQKWANANNPAQQAPVNNNNEAAAQNDNKLEEGEVQEEKGEELQVKGAWVKDWKKEYKQLPAMIKIIITTTSEDKTKNTLTFTYPLVNSKQFIIYEN